MNRDAAFHVGLTADSCLQDLLLNWSSDDIGCDPGQHVQVIGNSVHW
eukprot:SAG22_NODE_17_length_32684_cov_34.234095_12_plen_47_part_00